FEFLHQTTQRLKKRPRCLAVFRIRRDPHQPPMRRKKQRLARAKKSSSCPGGNPILVGSGETFTSTRQGIGLPDSSAARFSTSPNSIRSSDCIRLNTPTAFVALLVCRWPIKCSRASGGRCRVFRSLYLV